MYTEVKYKFSVVLLLSLEVNLGFEYELTDSTSCADCLGLL